MKQFLRVCSVCALSVLAAPAMADGTPCSDVVSMIAGKLDAKGVVGYTLTPTLKADVKAEDKVVGVCEAGTKSIVYVRGGAAAPAPAPAAPAASPAQP